MRQSNEPRVEGDRPFHRARNLMHLIAGANRGAEHDAGCTWRRRPGQNPNHRRVKKSQPALQRPQFQRRPATHRRRDRDQVGVATTQAQVDRAMQQPLGGLVVAGSEAPVGLRDQRPAILARLPRRGQTAGPLDPAGRDGKFAAREHVNTPQPVRRARGLVDLAGVGPQLEAPGQHLDRLVDPPDDLRRLGPALEILDAQRCDPVGSGVPLARPNPPRRAVVLAGGHQMANVVVHHLALLADPASSWPWVGILTTGVRRRPNVRKRRNPGGTDRGLPTRHPVGALIPGGHRDHTVHLHRHPHDQAR